MRNFWAEFVGTACLVGCGVAAIVFHQITGGAVTHLGIALTFGVIVLAMIETVGPISGAHLNPAVTIGLWAAGRIPFAKVLPYCAAQCLGAVVAVALIGGVFPARDASYPRVVRAINTQPDRHQVVSAEHAFGSTRPWGESRPTGRQQRQAWVTELGLTFVLMWVVLAMSRHGRIEGTPAGLVIGAIIFMEAAFGGPISGASMNPARSLGPAIFAGDLWLFWIYLTDPIAAA